MKIIEQFRAYSCKFKQELVIKIVTCAKIDECEIYINNSIFKIEH